MLKVGQDSGPSWLLVRAKALSVMGRLDPVFAFAVSYVQPLLVWKTNINVPSNHIQLYNLLVFRILCLLSSAPMALKVERSLLLKHASSGLLY